MVPYSLKELIFPISIFFILYLIIKKFSFKVFYSFFAFIIILLSLSYLANKTSHSLLYVSPGGDSGTTAIRPTASTISEFKKQLANTYKLT